MGESMNEQVNNELNSALATICRLSDAIDHSSSATPSDYQRCTMATILAAVDQAHESLLKVERLLTEY